MHNIVKIVLFAVRCLSLATVLFFNFISPFDGQFFDFKFFKNSIGNVSDKYYLEITPADWTFLIWNFIYAFQVAMIFYEMTTFCRSRERVPIYICPGHIPFAVDIVYIINNVCNILWLFAFDNEMIEEALGLLLMIVLTLCICLAVSARYLYVRTPYMIRMGLSGDYWATILVVHNGLGIYLGWTMVASVLNLGFVLAYFFGVPQALASTISLGVLAFSVVLYTILDLILFPKLFRFLFTPLLVLHVALVGSLINNWNYMNSNIIFELAIGTCGVSLLLTKIFLACTKKDAVRKQYTSITAL